MISEIVGQNVKKKERRVDFLRNSWHWLQASAQQF